MARPWVLVSLLLLIVFTSQLEWKQQFGNEIEASPNISQKDQQQHSSYREEVVKEKCGKTNWAFFFFLVLSPGCTRISAEDNYLCFVAFCNKRQSSFLVLPLLILSSSISDGFNMDQILHRLGFQIYQCFADFNWSFVDLQSVIVIVVFVLFLWMASPSLVISLLQSSLKARTVFQNSSLIRWNFLLDVGSPSILYLE
ncbi:hypothetical protein D5086_029227 [Populus alba]|uniref:Uncharacterized protein n=1 Tax=Populus alba TaxID=43335 RepID=A0ACC4ASW3_POPAL